MDAHATPPAHPADITAAWLSAALRQAGVPGADAIASVSTEIIGEERGFTGVVARIMLRYRAAVAGAPAAFIGKFPLAERSGASSYRELQASSPELARGYVERAAREARFYATAGDEQMQIPRCYFAHADTDAGEVVLLLEDLSAGSPGDALAGCSVAEARSVLAGVAALHARWWAHPALAALDWPGDWASGNARRVERYRQQAAVVIERYGQRLPPGAAELLLRLRDHLSGVLDNLAAAPATLIHLDLHLDNVMFMPSDTGPRAYLLDWQSVSRGPAMLDVAGFVIEALSIADRRAHAHDLLRGYHQELARRGAEDYPFERLWDDHLRVLLVRLAGSAGWLARVEIGALEGRERALVEAIFEPGRLFAALDDLRVAERLEALARRS